MFLKFRQIGANIISCLPHGFLRRILYSKIFGYKFASDVKIGFRTVIIVNSFIAEPGVIIGRNNIFVGAFNVRLGEKTFVGRFNRFQGMSSYTLNKSKDKNYETELLIGKESLINDGHFFDVYGKVVIGSNTWIAGQASQFWTHGASRLDRNISIGDNCYIGSAVRFAPGSGVGNGVIVGMGSVITKRISGNNIVVTGVPATKIKERTPNDNYIFSMDW